MGTFPKTGVKGASPADLAWLTGSWGARMGEDSVEEHWSPLAANTLMAMFRWVKDGQVLFYELEVLEQDGEFVYLRVKHFHQKLIGWEEKETAHEFLLVEANDEGAVFRELNQPDPRWAVYRRHGPERMSAYFTHDKEPDEHPGVFEFGRV